jgi:hypothetical protein
VWADKFKEIIEMMSIYPPLNDFKAHAKHISKNSSLTLGQSQDIVAKIYNKNSWACLTKCAEKTYIPSTWSLPLFSLSEADHDFMKELFDLHSVPLKQYFDKAICPPNCLLELIINKNLKRIEDNQISALQLNFDLEDGTTEELALIISHADNGAANILHFLRIRPLNLWLESSFFQQKLYAYYTVKDKTVFIEVREMYSLIYEDDQTKAHSSKWFADYMLLFAKRIDKQFKYLGYEPTFLFRKVNDCLLFGLVNNTQVNPKMQQSVLKVVDKLLEEGGQICPPKSGSDVGGVLI